jgi:putative colanic acid biosysnthesis UDP-glucose lipid carrier transferase
MELRGERSFEYERAFAWSASIGRQWMPLGKNHAVPGKRNFAKAWRIEQLKYRGRVACTRCRRIAIPIRKEALRSVGLRETKRALDVVLAAALLTLTAPFLIVVALAIKLDSPGPILFTQRRRGLNGSPFCIYKFRTMKVLEDGGIVRQATRNDPRVTRVGRILRKSSVDELPQLVNVIMGEMSLVGPRPHALAHDEIYGRLIDNYHGRYGVLPGITGWAQINGLRGETRSVEEMCERVKLDLEYIERRSIWMDIRILLHTPLRAFHKMAY